MNQNGNVGTLLYVHGNPAGAYQKGREFMTIADLTEQFIKAQISFDDVLQIARSKKIVYAPDATMQAMLSDVQGRTFVIEPGIGYREEQSKYSLITNYSLMNPESTKDFIVSGDDRYERALPLLDNCKNKFSLSNAFELLYAVRQEGAWATRVSFVYSANKQTVYYVENNNFEHIRKFKFLPV